MKIQQRSAWEFMSNMLRDNPKSAIKAVCLSAGRQLADEIDKEIRHRRLSQHDLAEQMGRSASSLSRFLRGLEKGHINIEDLARLSIVLQKNLEVALAPEEKKLTIEESLKKIENLVQKTSNKVDVICSNLSGNWVIAIPRDFSQSAELHQPTDSDSKTTTGQVLSFPPKEVRPPAHWQNSQAKEETRAS